MIILNTCTDVKGQYSDSEPKKIFSMVTLNKEDTQKLVLLDDIFVDENTATFLREFAFEWLESENKDRVFGIRAVSYTHLTLPTKA